MTGRRSQSGLTLVEVLVSVVLLAILLVPAISALQTGILGAGIHGDVAASQYRVSSRLEDLMTEPFADLEDAAIAAGGPTVPTVYSDTAGTAGRLLVYLSRYDGDNADADDDPFTGADPGLVWIRVDIEGSVYSLQTVRARGH